MNPKGAEHAADLSGDPRDTVELAVRQTLAQGLNFDLNEFPVGRDDLLSALPGVSSMSLMRCMSLLETRLQIELDDERMFDAHTVGDVCALAEELVAR